jgi:hypothetical protein
MKVSKRPSVQGMSSSTKLKKSELKVPTGLRRPVKATPSTPAATAGGASSSTPEGAKDAGEVKAARVVKPLSQKKLQKYQAEHENRGVCYLSRIPPYLKPSALREMLSGMGTDVLRVYLAAQQRGHSALARSGPRDRPLLQRSTRLLKAALWAREESSHRLDAEEGLRWRSGAGPPPAPLPATLQTGASLVLYFTAGALATAGGGELCSHEARQVGRQQEEEFHRGLGRVRRQEAGHAHRAHAQQLADDAAEQPPLLLRQRPVEHQVSKARVEPAHPKPPTPQPLTSTS